jgi:predicted transcriptional regulator
MLLAGTKTVELRRLRPSIAVGSEVLIYASSPRREMVGRGRVVTVESAPHDEIWTRHGRSLGLERHEYDDYLAGTSVATAISVADVERLQPRLTLAELRTRIAGFRPPQSFGYLTPGEASSVR